MSIGIGGAGGKLASLYDSGGCVAVNVSEAELGKVDASRRVLAVAHSPRGQFRGSGKNPDIGKTAFISVSDELRSMIRGELVFTSTGGGTGSGISSVLLRGIAEAEGISIPSKTMFALVLPYPNRESYEYVENTISFLMDPLSAAIDSGNTGNIVLFSNRKKFEDRIAEGDYNRALIDTLNDFMAIPRKGDEMRTLDGHIDYEDFNVHKAKPYFNHFCRFTYDPERPFEDQLTSNFNPFLIPPERTIEAMFLLEVPAEGWTPVFYNVLDHFSKDAVAASYAVVENASLSKPSLTLSMLYSRKPLELVEDFKRTADNLTREKLKKSIEQFVRLERQQFDIGKEVVKITAGDGGGEGGAPPPEDGANVLEVLKRLKKLR